MGKIGIALINLGTPDSVDVKAVRRYLLEFLLDKRVIDQPFIQRNFLVRANWTRFGSFSHVHIVDRR